MSSALGVLDLVDQADRRAGVAALLGQLLLSEPGPELAHLVGAVPELAALAAPDPDLAVEYERLFLRQVPPYESVFLGADGQLGGGTVTDVAAFYRRHDFEECDRWRVAQIDHLGLELRCYAHLAAAEARAWQDDRPDLAVGAVEAEREFLARHLGRWGVIAIEAIRRRAGTGPYCVLVDALVRFLTEEVERLRPAPDHPDLPPVVIDNPRPGRMGPARLTRWLLAPASCGAYLDTDDLAAAATKLGLPWRPSDSRSRLRQLLEEAAESGDLARVLGCLRPAVARWSAWHAEQEQAGKGASRLWREWRLRAERTLDLIDAASVDEGEPISVVMSGQAGDVLRKLKTLGLTVAVVADLPPDLADVLEDALAAGADKAVLIGGRVSAAGALGCEESCEADVVVRLSGARATSVWVDPSDHRPLAERIKGAIGEVTDVV